jgi:hypothetical protein
MKTLKIMLLIAITLFAISCNNSKDRTISGIYVMSFKNEYSIATDTIVIQVYNQSANSYNVERRDGYHRIREGKILPKEFRQEQWMATFDKEKMILQESAFGRQIYIRGDGSSLEYGGTYQRIK